MVVAAINTVSYGSTGTIMYNILNEAKENGISVYGYYGIGRECNNLIQIGNTFINKLFSKLSHLTGLMGCFAILQTIKLIKTFKRNKVEVVHLHNLHISFINYSILFNYFKKSSIHVVWTLHDCWAFTGHCPYFDMEKCEKWKTGCHHCPQYKKYPQSSFDNSKFMWRLKKKWFTGIQNMVIVTPSNWLANLVKESFLCEYQVVVINNGVDLSVFKPTTSNFRITNGIDKNKFLILGVAFDWGKRKGFDIFIELSRMLDSELFQIVLVGVDDNLKKKLSNNIIFINKTSNKQELAKIYSAADLFVNPTREETFGLVNIEAQACGLPVVTFRSGGSPETINKQTGSVVECDDVVAMREEIIRIYREHPFKKSDCVERAKNYDINKKYKEYVRLYNEIVTK